LFHTTLGEGSVNQEERESIDKETGWALEQLSAGSILVEKLI